MLTGAIVLLVLERPFFHDYHQHAQIFFEELAFALILAGLFGITIEKYQREEFVALVQRERIELKRDVFLYAYGHAVPAKIQDEIRERILECPFHREDLKIDWKIARSGNNGEGLEIQKQITYKLVNETSEAQRYRYALVQVTGDREVPGAQSSSVKIRRQDMSELVINSKPVPTGAEHLQTLEDHVDVDGRGSVEICVTIEGNRRNFGDDTYSSKHPIVGRTLITVRVEGDLELKASASCKGKSCATRTEHNPTSNVWAWELNEGLLPFQGIVISWSAKLPIEQVPTQRS
jgi:hypothetical protein